MGPRTNELAMMPRQAGWLLGVAYAMGLVMLLTSGIYDGPLAEPTLLLALVALTACGMLFVRLLKGSSWREIHWPGSLIVAWALLSVFAVSIYADRRLLIDAQGPPSLIHAVEIGNLVLLATYLWHKASESHLVTQVRFALFALLFVIGGLSVVFLSPTPHIDVWAVHTEGARALMRGENPYVVLHIEETSPIKLLPKLGFVYPPTVLYLSVLGLALGGDVRIAGLVAFLAIGLAARTIANRSRYPSLFRDAPALVFWLTPKGYFFLEQSWNDVYPVAFVALALLAHSRERKYLSAILLALAVSAKQTMIWFLPLALLLEFSVAQWLTLGAVGALTLAPFVAWDFHALKRWTIDLYANHPPRTDALTPMNWLYRHFDITPRGAPGVVLAILTSLLAVVRAPRTRDAFAVSAAFSFFAFYFFNRWMFMNYYFFVCGLVAVAAATSIAKCEEPATDTP